MNNETKRTLPHPGSPEASAMMDSVLAEYNWPANTKNAARAGWEAANRWLVTGQARASAATQAVPEIVAYRVRSIDPHAENANSRDPRCWRWKPWTLQFDKPNAPPSDVFQVEPLVVPPVALPALTDEDRAILEAVHREMDEADRGNAPGHCHDVPGIWDRDNGKKAGKPCAWCLTWAKFTELIERNRAILAASAAPAPEQMQPNAGAEQDHLAGNCNDAPCGDKAVEPELIEVVRKALHRAYSLGQMYWAEADSESYAANKRSEKTAAKMEQLSADTLAALSAVPPTVKE